MHRGFVKLHRRLSDNPLWTLEPFTKGQAWVDLVMIANHTAGEINVRGNVLTINRGEVGWSELGLSKRWQWSRSKVRAFIKYLEKRQQIRQQKNAISSIISITNYEEYQQKDNKKDSTRTAQGQHKDTNKNGKNGKKKNILLPDLYLKSVSIAVWNDWVEVRNKMKAPITETAIKGFEREALKAGITLEESIIESIERNWRGFRADWYLKDNPSSTKTGDKKPMMSDEDYARITAQAKGESHNV